MAARDRVVAGIAIATENLDRLLGDPLLARVAAVITPQSCTMTEGVAIMTGAVTVA